MYPGWVERFVAFVEHFSRGEKSRPRPNEEPIPANSLIDGVTGFRQLLDEFQGRVLDSGIYRLMDSTLSEAANEFVRDAFPAWSDSAAPFSCDWLGRVFAVDGSGRKGANGEACVLLLDPGTGDILRVPATVTEFHNQVLLTDRETALEESLWTMWSSQNRALEFHEVAGLTVPSFLGGQLVPDNLEIQSAVVYWGLSGQLIARTRALPEGTPITSVQIE
jgi:hypothetical protein